MEKQLSMLHDTLKLNLSTVINQFGEAVIALDPNDETKTAFSLVVHTAFEGKAITSMFVDGRRGHILHVLGGVFGDVEAAEADWVSPDGNRNRDEINITD